MRKYFLIILVVIGLVLKYFCPDALDQLRSGKEEYRVVEAEVVSVYDGDTVTVLTSKGKQKVRLYGIDAPEKSQVYGEDSQKYLSSMVNKKAIVLNVYDTDKYGRLVSIIKLGNTDVNAEMVKAGLAWSYDKYSKKYIALCKAAQAEHRGIFSGKEKPVEPWVYRHGE